MKKKTYRNPTVSITIRKPNSKDRHSFAFSKIIVNQDGTRTQTTMKLPAIDSINKNYHSKLIDHNEAITLLEAIKEKEVKILKEKLGFTLNESPTTPCLRELCS